MSMQEQFLKKTENIGCWIGPKKLLQYMYIIESIYKTPRKTELLKSETEPKKNKNWLVEIVT